MHSEGLLVIPAFNEDQTIARVVREVRDRCNCDLLVVDDASSDNTRREAIQAGAKVLTHAAQLGAWSATQTGIRYACRHDYPLVVTMDADGQHLGNELEELLRPLKQDQSDVVIGAFLARGSLGRLLAWRFFRALTGLGVEDLTSGFRAYNRKAINILESKDATLMDYQDIGILALMRTAGLRMQEVQVVMQPREIGKSRVFNSWLSVLNYLIKTLVLAISKWEMSWLQRNRTGKEAG